MKRSLLLIMILSSIQIKAYGQFDQFKSKTDFTPQAQEGDEEMGDEDGPLPADDVLPPPGANNMPPVEPMNPDEDLPQQLGTGPSQNGPDVFGRRAPTNPGMPNAEMQKKSKFVTLNPETAFGPEIIESFDFPNADILDLTKYMQKLSGINLILDKDVKGKISISAPSPITVGDAWKAYLSALHLNGYSLVKSGAFYKIINARDIRYTPTPIYTGDFTPDVDNYMMKIIPLKYISTEQVVNNFRPLNSKFGRIIEIKQTNTIIIHEIGSQINKLQQLIKYLDVPGHDLSLQIIKVKHSSAQEIAGLLEKILKGSGSRLTARPAANAAKKENIGEIIADPRTNSIIAMVNDVGQKELMALINKLDTQTPSEGSDRVHVYYLNYGDSETLAKTLSALITTRSAGTRIAQRLGSTGSEDGLFSAEVKITSDKDNNALVVTANPTDYMTIKNVISKLDIPKDQVYVEGLIMETAVRRNRGFGITILGGYGSGSTERFGFNSGSGAGDFASLLTNQFANLTGLFAGVGFGNKITVPIGGKDVEIKGVNGLIRAIAANSNTDVLATPQVLAQDNVEAVFEVGEKVPIEKVSTTTTGSTSGVESQEVKLSLKLTPQINKVTRFVKLKIDQRVEDFSERKVGASSGVNTTFRNAVTTVVVRDKDTIAMGGLMRDRVNDTEQKVPILGDIPILGWLFKSKDKSIDKVNMLFFMTPRIINPYEKVAAANMKDVLNRRSAHLKDIHGDDDPFATTTKGLYDKAERQSQGPLYDEEDVKRYRDENDNIKGINQEPKAKAKNTNVEPVVTQEEFLVPNYSALTDEIRQLEEKDEKEKTEYLSVKLEEESVKYTQAAPKAPRKEYSQEELDKMMREEAPQELLLKAENEVKKQGQTKREKR